jgi:hypothetical protein
LKAIEDKKVVGEERIKSMINSLNFNIHESVE